MRNDVTREPENKRKALARFIVPSCLGVMLFLLPVPTATGAIIPIAMLAKALTAFTAPFISPLLCVLLTVSALLPAITRGFKLSKINQSPWLKTLCQPTLTWWVLRILGAVFVLQCQFQWGFTPVYQDNTGNLVFRELLPVLFGVFILAGICLPLLTDFGLLEFIGTLANRIMRPLFNLPGRSAIDCITSWLGDGSVGLMLTARQYEEGLYTQREAAVIATTFSAVSITFALIVLTQVNLQSHFTLYYFTVCLCGVLCALILPRIPPLSLKPNRYIDGSKSIETKEAADEKLLPRALSYALAKAEYSKGFKHTLIQGMKNSMDMLFSVLPTVMAIGTLALMISAYTPLLGIIGYPFIPLLEILQIPEAEAAAKTVMTGFADMFIPSILAADITHPVTRFFVASLSVVQLIFLSEVGAIILASRIPVALWELFVIFILRTLISMPVIAAMAHLIF